MDFNFEEREKKLKKLRTWLKNNNIEEIIHRLEDIDPIVRAEAIMIMGNVGFQYLTSPLIAALNDNDEHVKYCAIEALGKIGSTGSAEFIINSVHDSSEFVKCKAINVLGKMYTLDSLKFLMKMMIDTSPNIYKEAGLALEEMLDYPVCEEKLTSFFEDNAPMQNRFPELYEMIVLRNRIKNRF